MSCRCDARCTSSLARAALRCRAQAYDLALQGGDLRIALVDCAGHVLRFEALRNVLRAVRVPGLDLDEDDALGARRLGGRCDPCEELGIVLDDAGAAPDLDARALG